MKAKLVRRSYGKPFSKLVGNPDLIVSKELLEKLGDIMVEEVIKEAKKEYAKQGGGRTERGRPEGLPGPPPFYAKTKWGQHEIHQFPEFLKSFDKKLIGKSTVAVTSTWPWIEQLTEGRKEFKMDWLTRDRVPRVPIVERDGTVVVRMTPAPGQKLWVHPGFKKHNFVQRGIAKARKRAAAEINKEISSYLKKGDPLF